MTDPTPAETAIKPLPLLSRIIGVITAPKATFENVVAVPRPAGVLLVCAVVMALMASIPGFTESGRRASIDAQVKAMEQFGRDVTPDMREQMEKTAQMPVVRFVGFMSAFVILPIFALFFAAIYWAAFNTVMGGTASFKQVLAIVTHSQVIGTLGAIIGMPIQMMQGTMNMAGPFNFGALAPGLDASSTLARFLGGISVFSIWGLVVTGIGLGVLYKRSGRNIAIALIVIFLLFMFGITSLVGSMMGRS